MPWHQPLRPTKRTWPGIALVLFLVAVGLGACGLLFAALPTDPTDNLSNSESTSFWITRGCCLGLAFSLAFLAYVAFLAGRREGISMRGEIP